MKVKKKKPNKKQQTEKAKNKENLEEGGHSTRLSGRNSLIFAKHRVSTALFKNAKGKKRNFI